MIFFVDVKFLYVFEIWNEIFKCVNTTSYQSS